MPYRRLPVEPRRFAPKLSYILGPIIVAALGSMTIASAQSPFASKKKKQAWEVPQNTQSQNPSMSVPQSTPQSYEPYPQPAPYVPPSSIAAPLPPTSGSPVPPQTVPSYSPSSPGAEPSFSQPEYNSGTNYQYTPAAQKAATQPSQTYGTSSFGTQNSNDPYALEHIPARRPAQNYQSQPYQPPSYQSQASPYPPSSYPPASNPASSGPYSNGPYSQKRGWKDKLGLRNLATIFRGFIKGGAAGVNRDDGMDSNWKEAFVGDAKVEFEISAVTDSGYEYGVNLEGRAQYDKLRRGFGGRIPDCPPTEAGCSSVSLSGTPTSLRGHTSRLYSFGADDAKEAEYALESAHLFLRSAYGDFTLGRDDGAAYLFSLGAPSLLGVSASNSSVDYTGLDSVKTVNDASGFSEKVTYTSPRLLGDTVGIGVQLGGSYSLNARACGVDYCVKRNDGTGVLAPDLQDIFEAGLALDRTFSNGMKIEATATYAAGSEKSGLPGLDDLQAYNAGAEVSWMDITLGGSFLKSNNGLKNGDYEAWDIGATWKPSALGFTIGYGHAKDDNVNLVSDQVLAGITYDFNEFTIGAGAQYIEREALGFNGTLTQAQTEKATALFVEGAFKF
jgi:hypothetical protein